MTRINCLLLFSIILLFAVAVRPVVASAQLLRYDIPPADSLGSLPSVPFSYLPMEACGMFLTLPDQPYLLVQDSARFAELIESKRFIGQCEELDIPKIDFSTHAVFGFDIFVDCNAFIGINLVRDTAMQTYRVVVDTYYGGCRAMRSHSYWLLMPALAEGETIVMEEHDYERDWRDREWKERE